MDSAKIINSVQISFIRTFTLPNFVDNFQQLNQQFKFLANSSDYSRYYKDLESSGGTLLRSSTQIEIPNIGLLRPLRKKHTMNSYWQSIRLTLEIQEERGEGGTELFLLMPLEISIPIREVKVDGIKIPINIYLYLFPFGSCCFNMDASLPFSNYSFDELSNLSTKILKNATLRDGIGSFEPYSSFVVNALNRELFQGEVRIIPNPTHIFTFIEQTSEAIIAGSHKYEILALMERKNAVDVISMSEDNINKYIPCRLNTHFPDEILYFNRRNTFVCPSRFWSDNIKQQKGMKKSKKKLQCMRNNYQSFLNVVFAVERFLFDSFTKNKNKLPPERVLEISKCFTEFFPEIHADKSNKFPYYGHAYEQISKEIGLNESLKNLKGAS